ncbi:Hypothetical predicted protein [Octopus vulgaris]|uniref:Uncharacterized protein n=1 Tax=Octopus vulgaris TaxID=6645 RepID=A0AA36AME2_OCTVU|nr:Hypothetical predicted protein [Octopus vulgaris]
MAMAFATMVTEVERLQISVGGCIISSDTENAAEYVLQCREITVCFVVVVDNSSNYKPGLLQILLHPLHCDVYTAQS